MKRLVADTSSDSDIDESNSISKIKRNYSKIRRIDESDKSDTKTKSKKKSTKDEQLVTIDAAFKNVEKKPKSKGTIDNFFKKVESKKQKAEISANDFFASSSNSIKTTPVALADESDAIFMDISFEDEDFNNNKRESNLQPKPKATEPDSFSLVAPKKVKSEPNAKRMSLVKQNESQKKASVLKQEETHKKESKIKQDITHKKVSPNKPTHQEKTSPIKAGFQTPEKSSVNVSHITTPQSASKFNYHAYLNRPKPQALGTKEIPEGSPNCLVGLTFVITGVMNSIERDDAQALIERHGGRVTKAVSGKTSYLITGSEPGESKIKKAEQCKTKVISEDELFDLIHKSNCNVKAVAKEANTSSKSAIKETAKKPIKDIPKEAPKVAKELPNVFKEASKLTKQRSVMSGKPLVIDDRKSGIASVGHCQLLVDKYRPTEMSKIIGQHGDRSPANKLLAWLTNWHSCLAEGFKSTSDERKYRAALLSGPPGIGKTTTAHVIANKLGYQVFELNASSTRSKNQLNDVLSSSLSNQLISGKKMCLIMDEVDGMAGNQDRGGITELISIIKTTRTPIICICNDRQSQKLRTFLNYVYDLPFRKLTLQQMKGATMSVMAKENFSVPTESLESIIQASNFDMRQVLNNLQMWRAGRLDAATLGRDASAATKQLKVGPFEVCARVFSHEGLRSYTDKSDLFFHDYQLGGLFVQENYPSVRPRKAKGDLHKTMKLMSLAADVIAYGDIVSSRLRSKNEWGLLPTQAMFASVLPGEFLHGRLCDRIQFPRWLGKRSSGLKQNRVLAGLCGHMRLGGSGGGACSSTVLLTETGPLLARRLGSMLRQGDVEGLVAALAQLQLLREDLDLLLEAVAWPGGASPTGGTVSGQLKSTLTKAYNKAVIKMPYAAVDLKKVAKKTATGDALLPAEEEEAEAAKTAAADDSEDDCMIVKKVASKSKTSAGGVTKRKPDSGETKKRSAAKKPRKK